MSYKLFLDDLRDPYKTKHVELPLGPWIVARNYNEFVKIIMEMGIPEFISWDHDLGQEHYSYLDGNIPYDLFKEKTGYDCAKWLVNFCMKNRTILPNYIVHSMNPTGKHNIINCLEDYKNWLNTAHEES